MAIKMMNFGTENNTFRKLLGNGLSYRVPPFQRDYSWTEDEWEDLWQDILSLFKEDKEPAHYMGYLVLQSSDNKQFDIIDGQQRMTTISVMILAGLAYLDDLISANLDAEKNSRRKEQFQNSYIGYVDPVTLVPQSKLALNRHNNRFYQTYLVSLAALPNRGLNSSEKLLKKSFEWFKKRFKQECGLQIESGQKFASMLDTLVDKLFFTVITVTDELNAFKVFETLNARGVRLSSTDLLKNYLFSIISSSQVHENEIRTLEDLWENIVVLLGAESFPEFLRLFWNSRNKLVRKADLFKTIRRNIRTKEEAFKLVRDLDIFASIYAALRDPQDNIWEKEEKEALKQLQMFNVRQPLSMLMTCYGRFFETDRHSFKRIVKAISIISFRYNIICSLPPGEQERLYNIIAYRLFNGTYQTLFDILNALRAVYPEDDSFKGAFANKEIRTGNSRNKKIVRYILFAIEKQKYGKAFDFESATYNLEHILPQNPSDSWQEIDEVKQDLLIYRIGNMTPLEKTKNKGLGNDDYETKRSVYAQSDFQMTQAISEHYEVWNEEKVEARQKQLANTAAHIWRIDFDNS